MSLHDENDCEIKLKRAVSDMIDLRESQGSREQAKAIDQCIDLLIKIIKDKK
jgi:hypothetical protein